MFHKNGSLQSAGSYNDDGVRDGPWKFYDSLNRISSMTEFVDGVERGTTTYFNEDGWMVKRILRNSQYEEQSFKDSILDGAYRKYSMNGDPLIVGDYKKGKKTGPWTEYHINGNKFKELLYDEGNCKTINAWDEKGVQTVTNGKGKITRFDYCSNGLIRTKFTATFKDGYVIDEDEIELNVCR